MASVVVLGVIGAVSLTCKTLPRLCDDGPNWVNTVICNNKESIRAIRKRYLGVTTKSLVFIDDIDKNLTWTRLMN